MHQFKAAYMHYIQYDGQVLEPDDGLIMGNGDLSVTLYQKNGKLIWRFGKNDVWDRRFDRSENCEPAHIEEIAKGIREEGWVSHSYMSSSPEATQGTADEKRMQELCNGSPGYAGRPYPCPKPVGELAMNLPVDQRDLKITQKVVVEKGEAEIECSWESGARLKILCFVPPSSNTLAVTWSLDNWNDETATGTIPIWFTLWRWADPDIKTFASELQRVHGYWYFDWCITSDKVTTLPAPEVRELRGKQAIEQRFYPDPKYTDGYRYLLVPVTGEMKVKPEKQYGIGDAVIQLKSEKPVSSGSVVVGVPSSSDAGGVEGGLERFAAAIGESPADAIAAWREETNREAGEFWGKSSIEIDEPSIENLWYAVLHARRSAYRSDVIAPGLAFPSTVRDYSLWHGDYHTNYNYQMPFWGNCTANHVEIEDAFFPGMEYMVELGRKLAKEYWNSRGTYIQLVGYPFEIHDDPYPTGGICRMAYMTGWISNHYWRRYLYTQDEEWLKGYAYPVIRDCALFYTDFLEKWDDGQYHAFPSMQGESFFTGNPDDYTDRPQVIRHAGYCLRSARRAAEILDVDRELQAEWREIADNLVDADDLEGLGLDDEQKRKYYLCPPEFLKAYWPEVRDPDGRYLKRSQENPLWGGIVGFNQAMIVALRMGNTFDPDRDWDFVCDAIRRWTLPNGMQRGLGAEDLGFMGHYVEVTGVIASIQEMMLQSWDDAITIFPYWPKEKRAKFTDLRAEGAFLVSASWEDGEVGAVTIRSERGRRCRIRSPWEGGATITASGGEHIEYAVEDRGILSFETVEGETYIIGPSST